MTTKQLAVAVIIATVALLGVSVVHQAAIENQLKHDLREVAQAHGVTPLAPGPQESPPLVALGQMLFFEKELSGNRDTSCASCHDPAFGTADGLPLAIGTGGAGSGPERTLGAERTFGARNTPDLINRTLPAWQRLFWDGRVEALTDGRFVTPAGSYLPETLRDVVAAQALFPLVQRDEMRGGFYDVAGYAIQPGTEINSDSYEAEPAGWHDFDVFGAPNELATIPNGSENHAVVWKGIMSRLMAIPAYRDLFRAAYPAVALEEFGIEHAANALAAFQADAFTLTDTPWDRFLNGDDTSLNSAAIRGAFLFYGRAGCATCHSGNLFTDQDFHNIAVPQLGPGRDAVAPLDYGRFHVTGVESDRFAFRTPSLRNVTQTGPWFHNGAYDNLDDVIRHHMDPETYLRRYEGRHLPEPLQASLQNSEVTLNDILATLDPQLTTGLYLSRAEVKQLAAFLESLTDPAVQELDSVIPDQVPSGLPVLP